MIFETRRNSQSFPANSAMGNFNSTEVSTRPSFDSLPLHVGDPKASAWGLWGDEDELGSLNLLNPALVKNATSEVFIGETIPLNFYTSVFFIQPMNPVRKPCEHRIIPKGNANDDEISINTQGATHWDGPRHYPYQEHIQYYNGEKNNTEAPLACFPCHVLTLRSIDMARKSITGRGVLLDWYSWATEKNITFDPFSTFGIPLSQLQAVANAQKTEFQQGDILLVRTGWLPAYRALTTEEQLALPQREIRASCGVEASEEAIRWHWDHAFAAVASDTVAYEAWPSPKPWGVSMHEVFLSGWGMPIGESFDLERLAVRCKELQRWSFMMVSVHLDIPGGIASPPSAVAIL
ncbi:putative cyclase-domain-containing protein [Colletotrichum phormii]|uniref:Cyclase-domain-containing protein n=1 Tax=Colletotrichum phormii TaxID=359342 RepID=A0AAI9ZU52_9PEZI|nr:putative cyclase-domain-containing protein [Colletotrichum phormii]KAK1637911.1 putative cyclase-domain-containing protein [Colletotrichum phormii]